MDKKRLEEIRDRYKRTTPGEWWNESGVVHCSIQLNSYPHICSIRSDLEEEDAEFIGNSHQDIPDLLDYVEKLEKELDEANKLSKGYKTLNEVIGVRYDELEKKYETLEENTKTKLIKQMAEELDLNKK